MKHCPSLLALLALLTLAPITVGAQAAQTPDVRPLADFEGGTVGPFVPGPDVAAVPEHATQGKNALRITHGYAAWDGAQDWSGYEFLEADVFNAGQAPAQVYVEIHDTATTGYWTRVNYTTVLPPGASRLVVPTDIYVGEKSRPGHALDRAHVTRLVLSVGEPPAPLFFDHLRLARDTSDRVRVPGLRAFSFGPANTTALRGFENVTPDTLYTTGRGFGFQDARIWRAFDVLQPDPLYERFICVEGGAFQVDLPDGRYHVFLNLDNPSGFWGEYQVYRERTVKANGAVVVHDTMDLARFRRRYYRFADTEDRPSDNTFDKYQRAYFQEKQFDVDVTGGKLSLEFAGSTWANSVSALVVYPASQAALGRQYWTNVQERRRFYFDNYFKRVLPDGRRDSHGPIPAFAPTAPERTRGYVPFVRDWMEDVPVNAVPRRAEVTRKLDVFASAGEQEPVVFSLLGLRDCGSVTVTASDLTGPSGRVPASALKLGVVSHRLTRVTGEGTVYTIAPRFVLPRGAAPVRAGEATTFWLTLHVPTSVKAGTYQGRVTLRFADGRTDSLAVSARLFATPLDALDIPAGPWGSTIPFPWYAEDLSDSPRALFRRCLAKMREYGCTTFSGIPTLRIRNWQNGQPDIDFAQADGEMADAHAAGFTSVVINYNGGIGGFNNYAIDLDAMKAAGFTRYADFLRPVLAAVDAHARAAHWLPVAYNLCDEPIGDAVGPAAENARAWREAAPPGLLTTGATSVEGTKSDDPHLALARALRIADLNDHSEAAVKAIQDAGSDWAFYNGGNRWTFGTYLYKCARQYGVKFRLSWHWNAAAGDPFYALDSREDDYAWCVTNARGEIVPSLTFERDIREGIDDYRYLRTLSRLLREHPDHPAAAPARALVDAKLSAFALGDRDHDAKWPVGEFRTFRLRLAETIERLSH